MSGIKRTTEEATQLLCSTTKHNPISNDWALGFCFKVGNAGDVDDVDDSNVNDYASSDSSGMDEGNEYGEGCRASFRRAAQVKEADLSCTCPS